MRPHLRRSLTLPLVLLGLGLASPPASAPARAADVDINGAWKLVLVGPLMENDFLLLDLKGHAGKVEGQVKDVSQAMPEPPKVLDAGVKDGVVNLTVKIGAVEGVFTGKANDDGVIPGLLKVNGQSIPTRLEKTKEVKLSHTPQQPPPVVQTYFRARQERDPKARAKLYREVVADKPGSPSMGIVYTELLRDAEASGQSEADVRKILKEWVDGAKRYGDAYAAEVRTQAVLALAGKKPFSGLTFQLAQEADASLGPDAPLQARADLARALADAAKLASKDQVAASASAKAAKLEGELDEEYHTKVPPFKPDADAGPKDRKSDRVVLLELFTGAQCPPCVAADVAFDALNTSYKTSQLVTLQYHLHIPGPDPLTSPDAVARVEYYPAFSGTPTTVFDGKALSPGGGPMANAKPKYDQYREIVDSALAKPSGAAIDLKVKRDADAITINASADAKEGGSKLKLRLALIEEQVRYIGGNGLRFHHHVVRALPGGVEGKALADGKGKSEVTVKLADLRAAQERYLSEYVKEGNSFPKALPPIDLAKLSVVAFVQNDDDKTVLNAASREVPAAK